MEVVSTIIASLLSLGLVVFIVWQLFALGKDLRKRREIKYKKLSQEHDNNAGEKKGEVK